MLDFDIHDVATDGDLVVLYCTMSGRQVGTFLAYVNAGLIDEFSIALSPVLFGSGIRLFEGVDAGRVALEQVHVESSSRVTHLTYAVRERSASA